MHRGLVLALAIALVVSAAAAAHPGARTARPRTLATTHGAVTALSQGRNRIAWLRPNEPCGRQVQILTPPRRRPVNVGSRHDPSCAAQTLDSIALGGDRVLWQGLTGAGNTELDVDVFTAALRDRRPRVLGGFSISRDPQDPDYSDPVPLLTASDGTTILFYWLCDDYCNRVDSSIRRVAGRRAVRLAKVVRPAGLAVAGRRFAVVTNSRRCCNYTPTWSSDGTRLAWIFDGQVWTVRADGTDDRRLTTTVDAQTPHWSPDGTQLVFARVPAAGSSGVSRIGADGTGLQLLASGSDPVWSPDGTRIAFVRADDVYTIKPDGTGEARLTTDALANTGDLAWSPDSTRLAATRSSALHIVRADGSGDALVTAGGSNPDWSPDGTKLAYTGSGPSGGFAGIFVINANGTGKAQLTSQTDVQPAWSPDGTEIAFASPFRSSGAIWAVNADGTNAHPLSHGLGGANPRWSPDGSTVAFGDDPEDIPSDPGLHAVSKVGTNLRRVAPVDRCTVEVRSAANGALVKRFVLTGRADEIALGNNYVALLVEHPGGVRIELYNLDGAFRKAAAVPASSHSLSAAGNNVVFAVGKTIRHLDARIVVPEILARARAVPVGLSIVGRRVAWAENIRGNARIQAVMLAP